ncbi:MAG: hypothetical protein IJ759_05890 [Bacteroidales bacterium]|nr:hypothetical protein [Bacteroidales bacterium]
MAQCGKLFTENETEDIKKSDIVCNTNIGVGLRDCKGITKNLHTMAYTRKYFLQRVKKVNEVYDYYAKKGYYNEWIYNNHIREQFNISRSTFYVYLYIDWQTELAKLQKTEQQQPTLF